MSDRIRQLEDALAILQSSVTREPHPLLVRDLLRIKSGLELHSASAMGGETSRRRVEAKEEEEAEEEEEDEDDGTGGAGGSENALMYAFGTLAVRDDGAATFYGRSAGSEVSIICCFCACKC